MRRSAPIALLVLATAWAGASLAAPVAVDFINASRPTRCAEEDNIDVRLQGLGIAAFRIVATHPPYIDQVHEDSTAPDFTACDMSHDPVFHFTPRTTVLYEDATYRLVGHTFATFWRPDVVDFDVAGRREPGLHLVQLSRRNEPRDIEILVVYPADGYWRAKPLPPHTLPDTAYGSSFLFGPIDTSTRPFVAIRRIAFDPAALRFTLTFANGTQGVLSVTEASRAQTSLALSIDPPLPAGRPFAALRSMFTTVAQADVAEAAWPTQAGAGLQAFWQAAPILDFQRAQAPAARFGRTQPSHHNLSAPDLVFDTFSTTAPRASAPPRTEPVHAAN